MTATFLGNLRDALRHGRLILGYCLLLLLITWALFFGLVETDRRNTVAAVFYQNDQLTLAYEEYVSLTIRSIDDIIRLIKAEYESAGAVTPVIGVAFRNSLENTYIQQLSIVGADGYPIANAFADTGRTYLGDRPHFLAHTAADTGRPFIGRPLVGRVTGKTSVHISRRLDNPDGSFAGVVIVAVSPDFFTRFFHDMNFQKGKLVRVVGLDGVIRASQHGEAASEIGRDLGKGGVLFEALAHAPAGHYYSGGRFFGTPRFNSYTTLDDYPLVVQVGEAAGTALAPFQQRRESYLFVTVLVSLFIISFSVVLIRTAARQRQAETRYRALLDQAFDAVAIIDPATLHIVEINSRFTALLGYTPADLPRGITTVLDATDDEARRMVTQLLADGVLPPMIRIATAKDGAAYPVERVCAAVAIGDKVMEMLTLRNLTKERLLEKEIAADAELAHRIQQNLLPQLPPVPGVAITTFYRPCLLVSGDTYHLEWDAAAATVRGYLVDVTGHGLATALQTATLTVLLRQVAELALPLADQLKWLNHNIGSYFEEDAFAAAIIFELDVPLGHLKIASAGINEFYVNGDRVTLPGSLLGLGLDDDYSEIAIITRPGDLFCLVTDGLGEIIRERPGLAGKTARSATDWFAALESEASLHDDATAICLEIGPAVPGDSGDK